jgi:hypothetical protein
MWKFRFWFPHYEKYQHFPLNKVPIHRLEPWFSQPFQFCHVFVFINNPLSSKLRSIKFTGKNLYPSILSFILFWLVKPQNFVLQRSAPTKASLYHCSRNGIQVMAYSLSTSRSRVSLRIQRPPLSHIYCPFSSPILSHSFKVVNIAHAFE